MLLIDDKFEQDHDQIVAKVKSVTNQPIKYVISTHYHADHSGGNGKMLQMGSVQIISTANSRKNILEAYHDALEYKEECLTLFALGHLSLEQRVLAEEYFWAICQKILRLIRELDEIPEDATEGLY